MFAMTQMSPKRDSDAIADCLSFTGSYKHSALGNYVFPSTPISQRTSISKSLHYLTVSLRFTMAPFFKSSSLFNISRRLRKNQKPLDTVVSSPPTLQSRSLPNLEELHGISSRFLEEFRPILQPQLVSDSGMSSSDFDSSSDRSFLQFPNQLINPLLCLLRATRPSRTKRLFSLFLLAIQSQSHLQKSTCLSQTSNLLYASRSLAMKRIT
jgi:hypothetical protein